MRKQLQLIQSKTFFEWYTVHEDKIDDYRKSLELNIFSAIEMLKLQYDTVMHMPVKRFYNMLKWKSELEEERSKLMQEKAQQFQAQQKQRAKK